jgi:hypothetical protein
MKVEGEFGYEAAIMLAMHAEQVAAETVRKSKRDGGGVEKRPRTIINVCTVLKDRFDRLNGQVFEMPTGEEFLPFLELLRPQHHGPVDTSVKSDTMMPSGDEGGLDRHRRTVLCEEIQGEMVRHYPGQTAREKACKLAAIERCFGTRSWSKVEAMGPDQLRHGLEALQGLLRDREEFERSLNPQSDD